MSSQSSYSLLIEKLEDFIKKYYLQKIIFGTLIFILITIPVFIASSTIEYNLYLSENIRAILFFGTLLIFVSLISYFIINPLYQYVHLGSRINKKKAAQIIGSHFASIQDKLINILELSEMQSNDQNELIEASIKQKIDEMRWTKFTEAIDWKIVEKYAKIASIPSLILVIILFLFPALITESTYRIWHYDTHFEPKAPFEFILLSKSNKIAQYANYRIVGSYKGKAIPSEMFVLIDGKRLMMEKDSLGNYYFELPSVDRSTKFRLASASFRSKEFQITVVPKAIVNSMEVTVMPPAYTGLAPYTQKDLGDLSVPEGSKVIWKYQTEYTDKIQFKFDNQWQQAERFVNGFGFSRILHSEQNYTVAICNELAQNIDTVQYSINIIPDLPPSIFIKEFKDSIAYGSLFYSGDLGDDYGVSSLHLYVIHEDHKKQITEKFMIPTEKGKNVSFIFNMTNLIKKYDAGVKIDYFFEVSDQRGQRTRSSTLYIAKPTLDQIEKNIANQSKEIKNDLSKSLKEAKELQKDAEDLKKKLLEKSKYDWNDKNALEKLLEKQKQLQDQIENTKNELKQNFEQKNKLAEQEKDVLEKQNQLEELMKQLQNPALNEMLKKMQELMQNLDKKELLNQLENMDQKTDKLEKELDRMLNLYKNLDYQQKMNDASEKLEKLAKEQNNLPKESDKNNVKNQEELSKKVEETKKEIDQLNKMSNELKKGAQEEFNEVKKDLEDVAMDQKQAEDKLGDNKKNDAEKKQKDAAEKLKNAAEKLKNLSKKQKKKQQKEDARMMRRLLENIIYLSFEQEQLIQTTKSTTIQSPSYPRVFQNQKKIWSEFSIVEDSLYTLSARQPKVKKVIFEEIDKINSHSNRSIKYLTDRNLNASIPEQQYAMTSYNNLSLMISESLRKMDDDDMESDSDMECDNPQKGKKPKPGSAQKLSEMQKQLNEQLEKLKKEIEEKNKQDKGEKPGEKPGDQKGGQGISAQMAKIAAQQQAIRDALKKLDEQGNHPDKSGNKPLGNGLKDLMNKMEQTEKELVNKKFYNEMLKRQKEIEVKLLEAAKAEREQEEEKKRESESGKEIPQPIPADLKKYLEQKKINKEEMKKKSIELTPFYQKLVEQYYDLIK
jgi:hypothetical protein